MTFEYTDRDIDVKTETELPGLDWHTTRQHTTENDLKQICNIGGCSKRKICPS